MFFVVVMWILAILLAGAVVTRTAMEITDHCRFGISTRKFNALSFPPQEIMKEYKELDKEYRPMPIESLYRSLVALETKHGGAEACTRAFTWTRNYFGERRSYTGWKHAQAGVVAPEFQKIRQDILSMQSALAERKHAAELAGVSGDLSALDSMREDLQSHTKIVREVTKELL
jgi:hypothetical protein